MPELTSSSSRRVTEHKRCCLSVAALLGCCSARLLRRRRCCLSVCFCFYDCLAFAFDPQCPPCAFGCCLRRRFCLNIFIHSACLHIDTHKHVDTFVFIYDTRDGPDERIAHGGRERDREKRERGRARRRGAPKHKNKFLLSCARLACCFAGLLLLSSFSFCFTVSSDCFCFSFSCFLTAVVVVLVAGAVLLAAAAAAIAAALSIVVTLLFLFI